jgi:phosphoglycolate phosphatase-like HAD superfamily hydrolase
MWMNKPEMARKWYNEHGHAKGYKKKKSKKRKKSSCTWYDIAKLSFLQPNVKTNLTAKDFDTTEEERKRKLEELFGSPEEEFEMMDNGEKEPNAAYGVHVHHPDLFADIDYATRERDFPSVERLLKEYYHALAREEYKLRERKRKKHLFPAKQPIGQQRTEPVDEGKVMPQKPLISKSSNWYKRASSDISVLAISGPNANEIIQYLTIKMNIPEKFIMQDSKGIRLIAENVDDARMKLKLKFPDAMVVNLDEMQKTASRNDNIIVVDFDNTIADDKYPEMGEPKDHVKEALQALKDKGYIVKIFSCRTNSLNDTSDPQTEKAKIEKYLNEHQIPFDEVYIGNEGKPFARHYIDDKNIEFKDNWKEIINRIIGEE